MVEFTSYTQSFKVQDASTLGKSQERIVRKRNRQPLSCKPCRSRRSRCDRGRPCSTCSERGEGDFCSYGGSVVAQPVSQTGRRLQQVDLQDRLRQLESTVGKMLSSSSARASTATYLILVSHPPSVQSLMTSRPDSRLMRRMLLERASGLLSLTKSVSLDRLRN